MSSALESLPHSVLQKIAFHLEFRDIARLKSCSNRLYHLRIRLSFSQFFDGNLVLGKAAISELDLDTDRLTKEQFVYLVEQEHFRILSRLVDSVDLVHCKRNLFFRKACYHGQWKIVSKLFKNPAVNPADMDNEAIGCAAARGHERIVRLLLKDPRVDPAAGDQFALRMASANGHAEIVRLLLQHPSVDPSALGNYCIQRASLNGHASTVQALLEDRRVDPTVADNIAIRFAVQKGHFETCQVLLEDERVDPSAHKNYCLKFAELNSSPVLPLLQSDTRCQRV
ncbi:ankyrin repeat-containing domain protein [Gorgonomyces haynaldii]|nr:ankyrin repeat-containing domain protein [Gorgonomyces haynaldii]